MQRIRFRNGADGPEIVLDEKFETESEARSQIEHLQRTYGTVPDAVAWLDGDDPPVFVAAEPPAEEVEPLDLTGPIGDILAAVGDDAVLAASVLADEEAADKPRKGLVEGLQKVIDAAAEADADADADAEEPPAE